MSYKALVNQSTQEEVSYKTFQSKIKNYKDVELSIDYVFETLCKKYDFIYTLDDKVYQAIFVPLKNKKIEEVLCILIDKTTIKQSEKKIIEANERYEMFLENIDDGIIVFEGDKKIYVNKACRKILKNSLDDIEFNTKDIMEKKEHTYVVNGKKVYVEMTCSQYCKNEKIKTIVVIRDVTSRKNAQKKLRDEQESYERLIDILPDGICLLNKNMNISYANKSFLNMLGLNSLDMIKNTYIKEVIKLTKEQEVDFDATTEKTFKNNKYMLLMDYEIINIHNESIQVEINSLPFVMYDRKYIMFVIKDLTNKKTWQEAEKELLEIQNNDKIKTEFFANMSHELKTPLNVISSSNQLIESFYKGNNFDDYNGNLKSHINLVRQNIYRLQRLINNIIDMTKMESGFYNINLNRYNIVTVIEDLFMKVEEYASKKDISLVFDTELEEINMCIDKAEIERVILNLLSNCIKFTQKGGFIYLNIYYKDNEVTISVKDTGSGIPKDKLNLVFEEFIQVDKTLSRNTEGSGIGLSIVKNLIKLHHGEIKVKSEENKGTEFLIKLPINELNNKCNEKDRSIYNIDEKIKIEFSDIYY